MRQIVLFFFFTGNTFTDKGLHMYETGAVVDNQYKRSVDNRLFTCCVDRNWCWRNHNACMHARARERQRKRKVPPSIHLIFVHLRILHLSIYWIEIDKLIIIGVVPCKFILHLLLFFFSIKLKIKHYSSYMSVRK